MGQHRPEHHKVAGLIPDQLRCLGGGSVTGNLIGMALNLETALGSMNILTMLHLPVQEHQISFHLHYYLCPQFFKNQYLIVFSAQVYHLLKFIRIHFIFNAIVHEFAFFVSLSDNLLLM